jgi:hypothetical protein
VRKESKNEIKEKKTWVVKKRKEKWMA